MIRSFPSLPLLLVSVLLLPTSLAAQTSLSVGGGFTMSKVQIAGDGFDVTPKNRTGITVGVSMTRPLSGPVALQVGGAYVQKGYKLSLDLFGESFSATAKMDYLELTALAKPTFPLGESEDDQGPSFHLLAGPALGISLSCSLQAEDENEDCANDVTAMDLSVLGGAGIQMGRFRVDATYTLGIMNIDDSDDAEDDDGADSVKHRSMALRAGFVIPIG